ncbi:MAG: Efflux ABC transporter, permease protein, partial [uncultured Thermomicrobiales bacterium]
GAPSATGVRAQGPLAERDRRRLGLRPTQLLPDQTLLLVGSGLAGLHHRQRDEHRLHRRGGGGNRGQLRGQWAGHHLPPDRGLALELPVDAVRHPLRDGQLGAVGRHHRVHVHGPRQPRHPPDRDQRLRHRLRHPALDRHPGGDRALLRPRPGQRQLPRRPAGAGDLFDLLDRVRHGRGGDAAVVPGEGAAGDVHLRLRAAPDLRRLLPDRCPAGLDAEPGPILPGLLRPRRGPRHPARRPGHDQPRRRTLAAAGDGRDLRPARDLGLPDRRTLRQADRAAEAERV